MLCCLYNKEEQSRTSISIPQKEKLLLKEPPVRNFYTHITFQIKYFTVITSIFINRHVSANELKGNLRIIPPWAGYCIISSYGLFLLSLMQSLLNTGYRTPWTNKLISCKSIRSMFLPSFISTKYYSQII